MKYLVFSLFLLAGCYLFSTAVIEILKKRKKRDLLTPLSVDIMTVSKGVSILIIMLAHIGNYFGIRYLNPLGSWGVGVFLFASGYGLERSYQKNGLNDYWKKRIKTAYLPYALVEVVNCIFNISYKIQGNGFLEILQDFLLIKPLHPFGWYMQCLFLYYISFYVVCLVSKKHNNLKFLLLFITSILIFVLADSLFKQQIFSFIIGVLIGQYYNVASKYMNKIHVCVVALILGGGMLVIKQLPFVRNGADVVLNLIGALQVIGLTAFLVVLIHIICKVLPPSLLEVSHWLGVLSNELYLIHGLVFALVIYHKDISFQLITIFFVLSFAISIAAYAVKKVLPKFGVSINEKETKS